MYTPDNYFLILFNQQILDRDVSALPHLACESGLWVWLCKFGRLRDCVLLLLIFFKCVVQGGMFRNVDKHSIEEEEEEKQMNSTSG